MTNGLVIKRTNDNDYECVEIYEYGNILKKICFCGEWRELDEDGKYYGITERSFQDIFGLVIDAYTNDFSFINVVPHTNCVSFWDSRPKGIFRRERKQVDIEYKFFLDSLYYKEKYDICVFLTCTNIFRKASWIKTAVNELKKMNL